MQHPASPQELSRERDTAHELDNTKHITVSTIRKTKRPWDLEERQMIKWF